MTSKQQKFVKLIVNGMGNSDAYKKAFGGKNTLTIRTNASKLAKRFSKEINAELNIYKKAIETAKMNNAVTVALSDILTQAEVDAKVCAIINGTLEIEKMILTSKGYAKTKVLPDHSDIMKAIDIYNKRFGSYAAVKVDLPTVIKVGYGKSE